MTDTFDDPPAAGPRLARRPWGDDEHPASGVASDDQVARWRRDIHDMPDAQLDEALVKLLELIHHKF
jgi:hypothetical protein